MKKILILLCAALLFCSALCVCAAAEAVTDAWGYTDDDGDGLILIPVAGKTYTGYLLLVLDPTRVAVGCRPDRFYSKGYTVADFAQQFDAVAAVNGGGFADPGGMGDGSVPDAMVVSGGEIYNGGAGLGTGFAGIDADGMLQVGFKSSSEVRERNIVEGAGYGPVLIENGEPCNVADGPFDFWIGTLNPRTAIAQRQDGAIMLLVLEGREPNCLGASYDDETELLLSFGAVNACNLDGGNSTLLWYRGSYLNNLAGGYSPRPMPTSYVVRKTGSGKWTPIEVSEEERKGLTKEEREALAPDQGFLPDNCTGSEKNKLFAAAKLFIERYVTFSADLNGMHNFNYPELLRSVVPGGELQQHLHGAFGSFGYWSVSSCSILSCEADHYTDLGSGRYRVILHYETSTVGGTKMPVIAQKKIALTFVRQGDALLVEDMTFF